MATIVDQNGRPIKREINITPAGTSGTDISGHRFFEEYLDALRDTQAADTWDEMRRSDDQVAMLLGLVTNLIVSANWFIAPADDSEEEQKIADFVSFLLFEDMGTEDHPKTFEKFKTEALTIIPFGYALFEITNKIEFDHPEFGTYVGIKGLDWRSPRTIEEWYLSRSGELEKVRQMDNSDRADTGDIFMSGKFLLHMAHQMEGDNYEGISMLRPIYGNWSRKNIMLKLQMIGMERAATGVPIATLPEGQINSTSQDALEDSLSRFVSHEKQYIISPKGYDITSLKIEHDADDADKVIQREDRGMAKRFMAGFLELGLSGGGAFALGTDWSDLFLSGLEVHGGEVTAPINTKLIPMMVKQKYGKRRKYPQMQIEGINDKAGKEFAEILKILKETDLLQASGRLTETVHKRYSLPYDKDLEPDPDNADVETPSPSAKAALSEMQYNLAEPSVGRNIERVGKEMSAVMAEQMRLRGIALTLKMMEIWRNAPKSQRMKQVNRLTVPGKNEYKKLIADLLADVYVQATAGVKKELSGDGLKLAEKSEIKALPAESKAAGASQSDLIVESQDADLRKNLFFSFTSNVDKLPTEAQMQANLIKVVEDYAAGASIRTGGPNAVANAVNLARNAIFQKKEVLERIESFVFTNPSPEAPICIELTGRVFTKEEYIVSDKLPPLHHHCNSWIKAQISGRAGNKSVSPAGLTIQGTDKQIEQIEKSITL